MSESDNKNLPLQRSSDLFPVVGIGASAGGLEAFKRLIKAIPESSGIAFILVQHLEPTHESLLTDLLQKITPIPVQEVTNNVLVKPDHIYIIPSNKLLTANDGRLQLSPRPPKSEKNMPIDVFFASLAEVHQDHAIGIVLSGTATDGTLGLKEIKGRGGVTFAQAPESATFGGMPQSAIEADVVDFVLPPEEIPGQLVRLNTTFRNGLADDQQGVQPLKDEAFRELLYLLRARKGTDFTYYKQSTIRRRIVRRMGLNRMENLADYLAYFRDNPPEQELLYHDLLIPVTGFFRDPKVYNHLCGSVLPQLLKGKDYTNPLRIWVAGCSTGEEPYSIAMCLYESLGDKTGGGNVQLFASDVSESSIAKARSGMYSKREIAGLSSEQQERYFTKVNGSFQVNKPIRDMCIFACHNFLKDPPFARMDLVSCRNVLIYMEPFLQKRALTTFHYALKESGYLLLGNSETVAPAGDLFTPTGQKEKLYARKAVRGRFLQTVLEKNESFLNDKTAMAKLRDDFQKSADETVLARYTPPGVVVNDQLDIVQFRGATGAWLEPSPGRPSLNVLKMAREGLAFELRNVLHKVRTSSKAEVREHIPFETSGKERWVTLEVIPLPNTAEAYYLILFRDVTAPPGSAGVAAAGTGEKDTELRKSIESLRIQQLERELAQLREDMRSITEDQEAVNEELQSANEELLSGSEELRSLNEELETSKEEIQSTNEELTTLNHELYDRNEQLNMARLYAESIVATMREPLVVLDKDMKVKTANKAYYKKFGTTEEQTEGRSLYALDGGQWNIPDLRVMLDNIGSKNETISDFEIAYIQGEAGERRLLLNASRIFQENNAEQMILLAIEDVTEERKRKADQEVFSRELERKVEERTISLREANISLKQSNDNLEQFATIASHDLQEPLRKIRTFVTMLESRFSAEIAGEAKELLRKIGVSAERMSQLIYNVLNFSKVLDASVFESTDLDKTLSNVAGDFDLLIIQKGAVIRRGPFPVIDAVPLQMNQLFYNLLGNALKFSKADVPPVIDISSRLLTAEEVAGHPSLSDKKIYTEILFQDNGIGFDQKFVTQIFLIFQRLNAREHFEGTGIGLALCQRIVMNHNGEISANSMKGVGAQFRVILPLKQ